MKKVFIIRHGETDFNRQGIVQGSGVDSSLNATGRAQARAFYEAYRDHPFDVVMTSELVRTRESVEDFLNDGLKHESFPEINEMSWGIYEGKKSTPESIAEYQEIKDGWIHGRIDGRVKGGESAREMGLRLQRFIDHLRIRPEKNILICSHGRAMCGLVTLMRGFPIDRMNEFRHSNLGLWLALQEEPYFSFELENDLRHLDSIVTTA